MSRTKRIARLTAQVETVPTNDRALGVVVVFFFLTAIAFLAWGVGVLTS